MPVETAFDLPLLFDPAWANPVCLKDGTHQWVTVQTSRWNGLVCDCCGAMVRLDEFQAVFAWWARVDAYSREDWGRN